VELLHRLETEALCQALSSPRPAVIAAAAAIADDEAALSALKMSGAVIVMLEADPDTLAARLPAGDHRRSLTRDEVVALSESRRLALLDLTPLAVVNTSRHTPEATVDEILRQVGPKGFVADQRG
jgi:shikimate kinase